MRYRQSKLELKNEKSNKIRILFEINPRVTIEEGHFYKTGKTQVFIPGHFLV